jgi:uncharacterized protein (TIGR03083 family)
LTDDVMTALALESQALSTVLRTLEPDDLRRGTNCPPWDLQELIVHIAASIWVDEPPFPPAGPHEQPHSAADYYRRPERDTPAYRQDNVDRTVQLTQRVLADGSAVQWYDEVARQAIAILREHDPDQVVLVPGRGPMRLADWVVTRINSVAAHGLDVAITLDRTPWTTGEALQVLRPLFVDLLGTPPPAALGWDDQTLLATANGRRTLTEHEADLLGAHAKRFPLIS